MGNEQGEGDEAEREEGLHEVSDEFAASVEHTLDQQSPRLREPEGGPREPVEGVTDLAQKVSVEICRGEQ